MVIDEAYLERLRKEIIIPPFEGNYEDYIAVTDHNSDTKTSKRNAPNNIGGLCGMGEVRRTGLTDEELDKLAERLVDKIESSGKCGLTHEQQSAVIELLSQKKTVVNATLYIVGALILWVLKDVYFYIVTHITWGRG